MPITGPVFSLDLGITSGFCEGMPGEVPDSGSVVLKQQSDDRAVAFSNMMCFLGDRFSRRRPALVIKERRFSMEAMRTGESRGGDPVMAVHAGLHAVVEAMCVRFGIIWRRDQHEVAENKWRKHFLGRARFGSRALAKAAAIRRCRALGLIPKDCADEDRADAVGIWDWACATFARRALSAERGVFFDQ